MSYALGLTGPSFTLDTACSSSAYALDCAYRYLLNGDCDAAIVAGSGLNLSCEATIGFSRIGVLAPDGICKPFDENAHGFTRSESICAIFLQKKKDAKRIYANVIYSKTNNDGFKTGSSLPSKVMQQKLMDEFYSDINFDACQVSYVEAHATGTKLGDPQEAGAIDEIFCKNRDKPLLIGSVKSNLGHTEAAAAIVSMAKIILAFESGKIAPNIHLTTPRADIAAFGEGRMKVVTAVTDLIGDYISMNSFGLGGANAHLLFKKNPKEKVAQNIDPNFPRLVTWSGRTEAAVNAIFDDIQQRSIDPEHFALLHSSQTVTSLGNTYRGFASFTNFEETGKAVSVHKKVEHFDGEKRPIVFVYTGMGSQWLEMGKDLMKVQIFAEAIEKCHKALLPTGLNLKKIITTTDEKVFNNVLNSYVGIIAIEIALTDILKALRIEPDHIIGHSVGELGCAYADGCLTAEETILAAYARGISSNESKTIDGAMAAVGLNHKEVKLIVPEDIDVACHNGVESSTVSGPVESVRAFVEKLRSENVFAKEVACSGIPLHSRYITQMGEKLLKKLESVISSPKQRTEKWLSSTYPQNEWNLEKAQIASADYFTTNLLKPVHFEEVCALLPSNSITIEVAPHALLKSILKKNLKEGVHLGLTQRENLNGTLYLLDSIGT